MITSVPNVLFMIIRILVACACGGAIGFERTRRLKEAGIRTHCIIAAGAALLMLISKYGFADLVDTSGTIFAGIRGADPARIAAQVVSGISFLGAGVIFKNGNSVKGLTTAAGIWVTSAVGLAIGSGMYVPGIVGTLLVVVVQIIFHRYSIGNDAYSEYDVHLVVEDSPEFRKYLKDMTDNKKIQIITMRVDRQTDGGSCFTIVLRTVHGCNAMEAMKTFSELPGVRSVSI